MVARRAHNPKVVGSSPSSATKNETLTFKVGVSFFIMKERFSLAASGYEPDRANKSKGEVVVNDSPADCQSHRADRSIFSAEKIQDRWFKSFLRNQKISDTRRVSEIFLVIEKSLN